ncbi:MAG: hypothetical protein JW902_20205 [Syntrophaceae bacterium]|nr:hypothetical protein [Syntrophaceae bacterium]
MEKGKATTSVLKPTAQHKKTDRSHVENIDNDGDILHIFLAARHRCFHVSGKIADPQAYKTASSSDKW